MTRGLSSFVYDLGSQHESSRGAHVKEASEDHAKASFDRWSFPIESVHTSKTALVDDTLHESEEDARKRRLGEMLRRRQHTGLDTGSATPTPPGDNS